MAIPKRKCTFGLAMATAYNQQPAAPAHVLVCNAGLDGEPVTYEQINTMTPDNADIQAAGFNYSFNVSNIEPNITQAGYIMAAAFGGDTIVSDAHQIVPSQDSKWLALYRDLQTQIGSSAALVTEVGLGAKIAALSFEISRRKFCQMAISGAFCNLGPEMATLTKALPAFPLSWHSLRAGDYKIGINGVAVASNREITGFKMDYQRQQNTEDNITLDSDQPNDITEGGRTFDFEVSRQMAGAQARAERDAWKGGQEIALEVLMVTDPTGTPQSLKIEVPHARITGSYVGEIGDGEDPVIATLKVRAFKKSTDPIVRITADDNTVVAWAA